MKNYVIYFIIVFGVTACGSRKVQTEINKQSDKDQQTEKVTENIAINSFEARYPLLAINSEKNNGKLPAEKSGVSLSRKGILVTAFGKDENGNTGTLLRVWEQAGNSGKLIVTLPKEMKVTKAIAVNLRGEKEGAETKISGNKFEFNLKAFAPASFILQ